MFVKNFRSNSLYECANCGTSQLIPRDNPNGGPDPDLGHFPDTIGEF